VLVFDHGLGGGASKYLEENILANHKVNIIVNGFHNKAEILIRIFDISKELSRCKFESLQYFYDNFIFEKTFKHVHINHLLTIDNLTLVNDIITNHAKSSTYLVHDFLAVCPSYTLINNEGKYCGTQVDTDICNKCQLNNQYQRRNDNQYLNMQSWRDIYYQILSSVKNILCFSQDSVNHLVKIYPLLSNKIEIKPHKVKTKITSFNSKVSLVNKDKINVAVLGAINYQKGRGIIQELVKLQLFSKKIFNLIIIGYADVSFINNCVIHGKYDPEVLSELVKKYKVDIFIIPSIWPETFCYTAEEVMMLEFPLISFNIGAHAERIINYEHGYLCDEVSAISLYNKIIDVSKKYGFSFICQK
jgi:glycosyltransferase involved in cell wall biosynthesis